MAAFTFKHGDRPLEGYVIQRGAGRGGFGEVYFAISDGGKEVALKYLRNNPAVELRGVSHCLNLKSPHLVALYDVRQNDAGEYFIVMEYISGPSLRDLLIAEPAGLGVEKAAYLLREISRGLAFLHDRDIVHRDLKPGNIFCEDGHVKIGDYGLAKFISVSQHSVQTASVGTVHYMAPEIGSGHYSRGVDIYALGVILYEMLLGRVPFEGSTMGEVLMKHLTAQPDVDELPAPFPEVIRRALAKDPKDRYPTIHGMVEAIFAAKQIACSVRGLEPMSLTTAAVAAVQQNRFRTEGSAVRLRTPPGLGAGSSNLNGSVPAPGPVESSAHVQAGGDPVAEERRERRRMGRVMLILGGVLIVLAPTPVIAEATGAPIRGWSIAAVWFFGTLSICLLTLGGILRHGGRARRRSRKLAMPLQRTFMVPRRPDLAEVVTRYFMTLGYHPNNRDPLLWGFGRGRNDEWGDDIRKYKTQLNVAAYETPEGYQLSCYLDVDMGWGWASQPDLALLEGELAGLERLLGGGAAWPMESNAVHDRLRDTAPAQVG